MLYLNAVIKPFSETMFIGTVKEFTGLVVQSESIEGTKKELNKSIRAKIAYDLGLDIRNVINDEDSPVSNFSLTTHLEKIYFNKGGRFPESLSELNKEDLSFLDGLNSISDILKL